MSAMKGAWSGKAAAKTATLEIKQTKLKRQVNNKYFP